MLVFSGALLPAGNLSCPPLPLTSRGQLQPLVMTNFIATPRQAQGHCAEVRTVTHSLFLEPSGKSDVEEEVPLSTGGSLIKPPCGAIVMEFQYRFTQSDGPPLAELRLPSQLCVKQDAEPQCCPVPNTFPPSLPADISPETAGHKQRGPGGGGDWGKGGCEQGSP